MDKWYRTEGKEAQRQVETRELWDALSSKVKNREFDDDYLSLLGKLQSLSGDMAVVYYYGALFSLYQNDIATAREMAEKAYTIHKYDVKIWKLLVIVYDKIDRQRSALFKGLCKKHADLVIGEPVNETNEGEFRAFTCGCLDVSLAPFESVPGEWEWGYKVNPGNYLVTEGEDTSLFRYYTGIYNPDGAYNIKRRWLNHFENQKERLIIAYNNFTFDIVRTRKCKQLDIKANEKDKFILQVAATKENQQLNIGFSSGNFCLQCGQDEFRHLRIEDDVTITSQDDFAFAEPIFLRHGLQRKKLVLNILLDGLSWASIKRHDYRDVPNLMKFFQKGIIFDNAFSVAEYTYPSLATIETGMYMHNSQVTVEKIWSQLDNDIITTSEQMHQKGYYCCNVMGDSRGVYNGVTRGFDRLLISPYLEHLSYEGVKRTIDHLAAFDECDNYVFLHVSDAHPFNYLLAPLQLPTQTRIRCQDLAYMEDRKETTVTLPDYVFLQDDNRYMISRMDTNLQMLFDYVEEHYAEDEYIVNVYSDHGTSIYSNPRYLFDDNQCNTALMLRGQDIPALGHVDELVSAMDMHKIMAWEAGFIPGHRQHDGNLPAVLGGKAREYVFSNSIYSGQTYKLCIRSKTYECRIESRKPVREDGSIDLSEYKIDIFQRSNHERIIDHALQSMFMNMAYDFTRSFRHI